MHFCSISSPDSTLCLRVCEDCGKIIVSSSFEKIQTPIGMSNSVYTLVSVSLGKQLSKIARSPIECANGLPSVR